jgi:hypothetical protein
MGWSRLAIEETLGFWISYSSTAATVCGEAASPPTNGRLSTAIKISSSGVDFGAKDTMV